LTRFVGQAGSLKRRYASQATGFVAVTIAAAAMIGWWVQLPLLSSWGSDLPTMRPLAALGLAALGLALVHPGKDSRVAFAVGLAVAALAALVLGLIMFNVGLDIIDLWLTPRAPVSGLRAAPFRVASAATLAFGFASGSLALSRFERHRFAATVLSGIAGGIAVFTLLGYLTGIDTLYGSVSVNSPPLPTAVGLLCIASGIVLRIGAMPSLSTPRPLRHLLIVLGCAIVAPLLLFGAYAAVQLADAQLNQIRDELMTEARILSADVDREVVGEIETLLALGASQSLRQGDFADFQRQAEAALTLRQSGNIMLVDRNMQQLVNTGVPFGTTLDKAAVPEPTEKALATGKPQVTGLFVGPVTKQLMYGIIVPVEIDGENRYALVRSPNQRALARVVAANELPPGQHAVISDAANRIIARSEQENAFFGKELPPAQWHRAGPGGIFDFIDTEGRPSLQAYASSDLTGWQTAVWAPKALLLAPLNALWWTLGGMALLAFALVVGLALWLGRIVADSVGHAARTAVAWGEGGPLSLNGTPVAEVNTLMTELRETAARRQTAEGLLRDSEESLRLALNAAQLGSWRYDPLHRVVSGDTRFKEILDIGDHETVIDEIVKRVHPDDAGRVRAAFDAALDPADPTPLAVVYRVQRKDGGIRWMETHGLAYFEDVERGRRAARVVGTVADITERKENAEKAHLLTREINHRAKNMLSVVDAISHQIAAGHPGDFAQRFSERIQALSTNQDLLIRNEWKGVEIEDLIRAQLAHFTDVIGSRIAVQGPKLLLRGAAAQAIGLALHELATNAGKYGALSTNKGRVDICWGCDGDTLTMSWTEREGPPVSAPERRGFGTIVMKTMAERSLDGTVQLDYAPSGLIWRLTCPAASALESGWGS
jgi:PAS domain S-box-containing protein